MSHYDGVTDAPLGPPRPGNSDFSTEYLQACVCQTPLEPLPELMKHTIEIRKADDEIVTQTIYGRLLGTSTNETTDHANHAGTYAPQRVQCFACRWTEISIYGTRDDPNAAHAYLVHTIGRSDVPGEVDFVRSTGVRTGTTVLEALVAKQRGTALIPHAARMALAEAAAYDMSLRAIWVQLFNDPQMGHIRMPAA